MEAMLSAGGGGAVAILLQPCTWAVYELLLQDLRHIDVSLAVLDQKCA
jgi:hypothetical protein